MGGLLMNERGKMHNESAFKQGQDFSGLRWNKITPTDVDGLIDFGDKLWIIFELKKKGNGMPDGQRLAYERLTDDLAEVKPTVFFLAEHTTPNEYPIDAESAIVIEYRFNGKWNKTIDGHSLKLAIDMFREKQGKTSE